VKRPSDRSDRKPVPHVLAIVRWNARQLLADQAILAGAKNEPLRKAMPLGPGELGYFISEYEHSELLGKPVAKPVPPDLLWLLRRSRQGSPFTDSVYDAMYKTTEKGSAGYTKLVLMLIDRCFAPSASDRTYFYYKSIVDVADPILLKRYRINTRRLR
jgi:hypothetical protein